MASEVPKLDWYKLQLLDCTCHNIRNIIASQIALGGFVLVCGSHGRVQ